ncbi:MAG: hypothetical protein ACRDFB_05110 [Rhabdochlamydiaceae bacterium]
MKLDVFITNVLLDIDKGLNSAKEQTGKKYQVEGGNNKGVEFDIAVTTVNSTEAQAEGKAKVGFVEVLGAGVGAKLGNKNENSEISRIQFTIYVPPKTEQEIAAQSRESALVQSHRNPDPYY